MPPPPGLMIPRAKRSVEDLNAWRRQAKEDAKNEVASENLTSRLHEANEMSRRRAQGIRPIEGKTSMGLDGSREEFSKKDRLLEEYAELYQQRQVMKERMDAIEEEIEGDE